MYQSDSNTPAAPMPVPMHAVIIVFLLLPAQAASESRAHGAGSAERMPTDRAAGGLTRRSSPRSLITQRARQALRSARTSRCRRLGPTCCSNFGIALTADHDFRRHAGNHVAQKRPSGKRLKRCITPRHQHHRRRAIDIASCCRRSRYFAANTGRSFEALGIVSRRSPSSLVAVRC